MTKKNYSVSSLNQSNFTLVLFLVVAFLFTTRSLAQNPNAVQQFDGSWQEILTTAGAGTWSVPDNVYEITIEAVGGGGGGAMSVTSSEAGGGGGGAYARSIICVTPDQSISYNIGSGGLGANTSKNGGNTWFVNSSTVFAKGGDGTSNGTGGAGGAAEDSIGDVTESGENGTNGNLSISGAGGNAGYATLIGNIGGNTGIGGAGVTSGLGNSGALYGSGGSGGKGSFTNGGSGARGVIRITYYVHADITSIIANPTYCASENNIMLTATKSTGLGSFSTLWFEGVNPSIHFTDQFITQPTGANLFDTNIISNSNGVLRVGSTSEDPYIVFDNIPAFDASTYSQISLRYKYVSGTATNLPSIKNGESEVSGNLLVEQDEWHIVSFDISEFGNNMTNFELHWASDSGVTLDLDYIVLASAPVMETQGDFTNVKTADNSITVNTGEPNAYYALRLIEEESCFTDITYASISIGEAPEATFEYGEGVWNIYVWNAADDDALAEPWEDNYSGFLVTNSNDEYFSSDSYWLGNQSPSYYGNYTGCYVNPNRHSLSARQTGFACGVYNLIVLYPELNTLELYINNELVEFEYNPEEGLYTWTGSLVPEDEVEFKYNKEEGESSLAFVFSGVEFDGGTINYPDFSQACFGGPVSFEDVTPATDGVNIPELESLFEYQWQVNFNDTGFTDIEGANEELYTEEESEFDLGTYIYRRKATDNCNSEVYTNEITIIRSTLGPLTGGNINYSPTMVCFEEAVVFDDIDPVTGGLTDPELGGAVMYQWEVNYNDGGFVDIVGATEEFYTTTETTPGTYVYKRKVTDNCEAVAYTNEVTVIRLMGEPLDAGLIDYPETSIVCAPEEAIDFDEVIPATGGVDDPEVTSTLEYQWEVNYNNGGFEDIVGATSEFYITTQTALGTYVYRRKVTDTYCGTEAWTNEITIIRPDVETLEGGTINYLDSSIVCSDSEVVFDDVTPATGGANDPEETSSLEYQWQVNYNDGGFEDIIGATDEFYTTTQTELGEYIYRRKATDYCSSETYTNEITITRAVLDPLTGGEINHPSSVTICSEQAVIFDDIDSITGGHTDVELGGAVMYQWEVNYNEGGFEDIVGATSEFYTTTETASGEYIYRRRVTDNCEAVAYTNVITVNRLEGEPLEAGLIDYSETSIVCTPEEAIDFDVVTPATGGVDDPEAPSTLEYQWEVNYNDGDFEDIVGATGEFYTTTQTASGTYVYRRKVTDTYCSTEAWTNEITIIRPDIETLEGGTINYLDSSQACFEGEVVFDDVTPATGGASSPDIEDSLEYQWQLNFNDTGFIDIDNATDQFYTTIETALGTYVYRRRVTDFCENKAYTNEIIIIRSVAEALTGGEINHLSPATVCPEQAVTFDDITPVTGGLINPQEGGSIAYQWEVNYNGGGFVDIVGATEEFYTTTAIALGEYIYRRRVSEHCGAIAYTNDITILRETLDVLDAGIITYSGASTVCPVQSILFNNVTPATGGLTNPGMGGAVTYQWEVNHNGGGFVDIVGATGPFYTTTQTAAGEYIYRRKATDSCGTIAYTNEITIERLIGGPLVGGVITYTAPALLCTSGQTIIFNDVTPALGGVSDPEVVTTFEYQWEVNYNSTGFVDIVGATDEFYTTTDTALGNYIYRRRVTDTYCGNSAWSNAVMIIRSNLAPLNGGNINYLTSSIVCPTEPIAFDNITPATGGLTLPANGGTVTYQWEVNYNGGGFVDIVGATEEFYTTTQTALGEYIYRRKATDYCGSEAYSNTITITREELDSLDAGEITYADSTTVCYGDIVVFDTITPATGGLTDPQEGGSVSYQWELSTDEGDSFAPITGATTEFYTTTETGLGTFTYRRKVTDHCGTEAWTNHITINRGGKVFTGDDSAWNNSGNWTPSGVPTATDCVVIPTGKTVVISTTGTVAKDILIESGGTFTINTIGGLALTVTNDIVNQSGGELIINASSRIVVNGQLINQSGGVVTVNPTGHLIVHNEIINQSVASDFTVKSSGNLIQINNVTNTGAINVQRISNPMGTYNFTYWGAPVSTTLNSIAWHSESTPDNFTVSESLSTSFAWNASTNSWDFSQIPYLGNMNPGYGYIIKAPNSFLSTNPKKAVQATFSGVPNTGDYQVNIVPGNHNLLSNPYPSAIDINLFLSDYSSVGSQIQGAVYLWKNGDPNFTLDEEEEPTGGFEYVSDFVVYNYLGSLPAEMINSHIGSGQAFFVIGDEGGTVTFKNSYRSSGTSAYFNNQFFKVMDNEAPNSGIELDRHRFWLNLTGENIEFKQTLIGYSNLATDQADFLDAVQLDAGNPTNLYTKIDDTPYSIQSFALPFENTDETPLGYTVATAGTFTITLHAFDGLFDNQDIYIKDSALNVVHNLKDSAYEFLTDAGTFEDRLSVVYVPQGGLDTNIPEMAQNWIAYLKDGQIQLESLGFDMKEVYVYDMLGREIYAKQNINSNQHTLNRVNGNQVLIVKVISTDNVSSVKKVQN